MPITRSDVASYLDEQFASFATAIGQNPAPTTGYKPDIDNALRAMDVAESDLATATVADGKRKDIFVLSTYYAALRMWRRLGDRVNTSTGTVSYNFDGQRKQAKEIMDDAKVRCAALGYDVSGGAWSVGTMTLDFLEPGY